MFPVLGLVVIGGYEHSFAEIFLSFRYTVSSILVGGWLYLTVVLVCGFTFL